MKLTIFGASGATGTCLTTQALAAGHTVTAVVRDPARLTVPNHQRLEVITADILDSSSIYPAIDGADDLSAALDGRTVVFAAGAAGVVLLSKAARLACKTLRVAVDLNASIVADQGESPYLRYLLKPLVRRTFLRNVCADFRATEDEIHASGLDWTIFRPPSLTAKAAKGTYRIAIDRNLPHCFSISRPDLAAYMLTTLEDSVTVHRHLCIAN